mmetsp:Transcript_10891/g.29894  ORF Transcript_10891/g.29894 Transcript_10891/m.29894 type:complete len:229 (+) Transcript_10891:893-1579(+)
MFWVGCHILINQFLHSNVVVRVPPKVLPELLHELFNSWLIREKLSGISGNLQVFNKLLRKLVDLSFNILSCQIGALGILSNLVFDSVISGQHIHISVIIWIVPRVLSLNANVDSRGVSLISLFVILQLGTTNIHLLGVQRMQDSFYICSATTSLDASPTLTADISINFPRGFPATPAIEVFHCHAPPVHSVVAVVLCACAGLVLRFKKQKGWPVQNSNVHSSIQHGFH